MFTIIITYYIRNFNSIIFKISATVGKNLDF